MTIRWEEQDNGDWHDLWGERLVSKAGGGETSNRRASHALKRHTSVAGPQKGRKLSTLPTVSLNALSPF
jgi:hypothetical protein